MHTRLFTVSKHLKGMTKDQLQMQHV